MQEFVLTTSESIQSKKLIAYLRTLDYVTLKPTTKVRSEKVGKQKMTKFLEELPEVEHDEQDVLNAIKEMRND